MYINRLSDYLKESFGTKLYRISLDGGMTCPNRDGSCGTKGCIFCGEKGSGEFTPDRAVSLDSQIEGAKALVAHKAKSKKYIAYFQAFSNTYAPIDYLRELYYKVILREDIEVLSIATRPDCINDSVIKLLDELNRIKPVWIELGLQTCNEKTARLIRRGYENSVYENAVASLKKIGCQVITHIIFGLPHESKEDMLKTARYAGKHSDGLKLHMLYITKSTDLAKLYEESPFHLLSREEYIDILCCSLRLIPKDRIIHRLTGDACRKDLIAPLWTKDKRRVLREIENAFKDRNICQGEGLV